MPTRKWLQRGDAAAMGLGLSTGRVRTTLLEGRITLLRLASSLFSETVFVPSMLPAQVSKLTLRIRPEEAVLEPATAGHKKKGEHLQCREHAVPKILHHGHSLQGRWIQAPGGRFETDRFKRQ